MHLTLLMLIFVALALACAPKTSVKPSQSIHPGYHKLCHKAFEKLVKKLCGKKKVTFYMKKRCCRVGCTDTEIAANCH